MMERGRDDFAAVEGQIFVTDFGDLLGTANDGVGHFVDVAFEIDDLVEVDGHGASGG